MSAIGGAVEGAPDRLEQHVYARSREGDWQLHATTDILWISGRVPQVQAVTCNIEGAGLQLVIDRVRAPRVTFTLRRNQVDETLSDLSDPDLARVQVAGQTIKADYKRTDNVPTRLSGFAYSTSPADVTFGGGYVALTRAGLPSLPADSYVDTLVAAKGIELFYNDDGKITRHIVDTSRLGRAIDWCNKSVSSSDALRLPASGGE
jgi:hypothetical protein